MTDWICGGGACCEAQYDEEEATQVVADKEAPAPEIVEEIPLPPAPKVSIPVDPYAPLLAFKPKLMKGIKFVKHGNAGDPKPRILYCDPSCTKIGWKTLGGGAAKTTQMFPISKCSEVRKSSELDPATKNSRPMLCGTANLRRSCDPAHQARAFSLIFPERSVDIQLDVECDDVVNLFRLLLAQNRQ